MLKIRNTLSKEKKPFTPLEKGRIRFYHCGPTVYWTQHIGNMRAMVMADFIRRSLTFLGFDVSFVRNYTDVGHLTGDNIGDADEGVDRMEKASKRDNLTPERVAQKYITEFERDTTALNILPPSYNPRATQYIQEMIAMTETLLEKGFAYATPKAIYFDTSKAKDYTRLSGQKIEEHKTGAGFGSVADPEKRSPTDFALWFFKTGNHKNALQTWPSPFTLPEVENGEGFPGWHIECSAMSKKLLGETLDIHMGGIEHIPIHHTNEIAQSESANGKPFVNYWLHNEHLLIDGGKMSKSEGNVYFLKDIIDKGFDPLVLRYFFLGAHYRSQQNFTWKALEGAQTAFERLKHRYLELGDEDGAPDENYTKKFKEHLEDDFDIPGALALTWDLLKDETVPSGHKKATLLAFDTVFGLSLEALQKEEVPIKIQQLAQDREQARKNKDWEEADRLRERVEQAGFTIEDTNAGPHLHKA